MRVCLDVVYLLIYRRHLIQSVTQYQEHYGIRGVGLDWFSSYLYDRKQYVSVNGATNVKAKVLHAGSLSKEIDILQGTGQGRILASFMYKVYINSLLKAQGRIGTYNFVVPGLSEPLF